jgi:hypothetical protein
VQIGLRYEHQPVAVGETARVTVTLKAAAKVDGIGAELKLPEGRTADPNDPCRIQPLRTVDWRITAQQTGDFTLVFGSGSDTVEMPLRVGSGFGRVSRLRGGAFFDRLLYSGEPSIPTSSVFEAVQIDYPSRSTPICGLDVHWLISLLVLSIVFALLFKPILKVHI